MNAVNTQPDARLRIPSEGGVELSAYRWDAASGPEKGAVHITHGVAEHALRYGYTARALNRAGYVVYAHDHRGHGGSDTGTYGFFAEQGGWDLVVGDLHRVNRHVAASHPELKRVVLGHSMGSFIAQDFLSRHGDSVAAAVLSGTGGGSAWLIRSGYHMARMARMRVGARGTSGLLEFLIFGPYNLDFRPVRTKYDWLSRDAHQVDLYAEDPLCGQLMPVQSWIDIFGGMLAVQDRALQARVPKALPVWMMSGAMDPVGRKGAGVKWLEARYRDAGMTHVESRLYPNARHEVLNETNRDEVIADLVAWLDRTLPSV